MELYRLTKKKYQHDLMGLGAYLAGGRWNPKGLHALYTASSRSLAVVESLAHLVTVLNLEPYVMLVMHAPDDLPFQSEYTQTTLRSDWKNDISYTQSIGERFLRETIQVPLLRVPSAIIHNEYNFVLNPSHPEAKRVQVIAEEPFSFDHRLKQ